MTGTIPLGREIGGVVRILAGLMWYPRHDFDAGGGEPLHFGGIVGKQPDAGLPEQLEHLRGYAEIAYIDREAEPQIGVDRIEALILQRIGTQFIDKADSPPFLSQIEQHAPALRRDAGERGIKLWAAIAFE